MKTAQALLVLFTLTAGCSRDSMSAPPGDEGERPADLAVSPDPPGPDMARPDMAGRRGWTRALVPGAAWLNAVWGSGPGDVYAVGLDGVILHSSGDDRWTQQKTGRSNELTSVFGSGPSDVYAVESSAVLHSTGDGVWSVVPNLQPEGSGNLRLIWLASASQIYVAGSTGRSVPAYPTGGVNLLRWQPPVATREFAVAEHHLGGLWGSSGSDLWAVGSFAQGGGTLGLVLHSNGDGMWSRESFQPDPGTLYLGLLTAVWASSKGDVYAAAGESRYGSAGIFRSSGAGTAWRRETDKLKPPLVYGLWGSGPSDVWAVGVATDGTSYNGLVLRSHGDGVWAPDAELSAADVAGHPLRAVWGSRYGDVYLVGHAGLILHKRE